MAAAVISRHRWGWYPASTAPAVEPICWVSANEGDKYLRRLLVQCARVYLQRLEHQQGALAHWVRSLRQRRHANMVVRALANKFSRVAWAFAANHSEFEAGPVVYAA
jgi:hypothetical protein